MEKEGAVESWAALERFYSKAAESCDAFVLAARLICKVIYEVVYEHKIETQLKVDIVDKVRSDRKKEREAKRKELLAAYKAKK